MFKTLYTLISYFCLVRKFFFPNPFLHNSESVYDLGSISIISFLEFARRLVSRTELNNSILEMIEFSGDNVGKHLLSWV